jgi:hypothetical protein
MGTQNILDPLSMIRCYSQATSVRVYMFNDLLLLHLFFKAIVGSLSGKGNREVEASLNFASI